MKKIFIPIIIILITVSCGGDKNEMIKQQITQKKEQITRLNKEIKELEATLSDTINKKEAIPATIKEMQGEAFNHYIIAYGEVEAENYALITPEMPGQIKKIHVREGERVAQGQLLVSLNTETVRSTIDQLKTNYELAEETYEKQKNLWDQKIGSEIQYLQAKTAKESLESQIKATEAQFRMAQIRAPYNGYVNKIYLKEGELASQMMPLVEFVNMRSLSITADISENYVGSIKKGQVVEISFASIPDLKIKTPIRRVSKVIDQKNRTFEIELKIDNRGETIKPFMVSTIRINDFSADSAFVIPSVVMKQDISGRYVYLIKKEGSKQVVVKKYITPGLSYQDQTMVDKGLTPGDKVIIQGYNLVSSGVPVQVR